MPVPQTKAELTTAINKEFDKLMHYLNVIPHELTLEHSMDGHAKDTTMSIHNLVSYLLGWNQLVIQWITEDEKGIPVDFPATGYQWNQLGLLAQKFYADYAHLDFLSLMTELQSAQKQILQLIDERTDAILYGQPWYTKWTMGRMISFNTSSPYANANGRLRKWAKQNNISLK